MNRFLDREFLDNSLRDYLWIIGVILLVIFLNRVISKYIAILLAKSFRKAWKTFDQKLFVELIIHPLGSFLVISISIIALYRLRFPEDLNITLYKYPLQVILISIFRLSEPMIKLRTLQLNPVGIGRSTAVQSFCSTQEERRRKPTPFQDISEFFGRSVAANLLRAPDAFLSAHDI